MGPGKAETQKRRFDRPRIFGLRYPCAHACAMDRNQTGRMGENVAARLLEAKGYRIEARNFRAGRSEVDIIAWDTRTGALVFVEVKTRASDAFGGPEGAVDTRKMDRMARVAGVYMDLIGHEGELRFDIVSILMRRGVVLDIRHFEDVFFPM